MPKQVENAASDDYLSAIYRLTHDEGLMAFAVRLSDRLAVTPPSVAGMLKRLQRDNLVNLDKRKSIMLTKEGLNRAEKMVRRHRLAECLLTSVMKIPWWQAYEEAHLLEHGISDVTEHHLFKALGKPTKSPFGYPIPGTRDANQPLSMSTLSEATTGTEVQIDRVFEEDEQLLQFFDTEGLHPGTIVKIELVEPYRGTLTVRMGSRSVVLGSQVAERLWTCRPKS
jgi:DtxR family Mn-dependent transcriptional regulator